MKKRILIGAESFEEIIQGNYFYVDKTLFINELLENKGKVTLITRPRKFGKTLNMSMLEHFFDITKDNSALFDGLDISKHEETVSNHMNKYPVVFLSLKDAEDRNYANAIEIITDLVAALYRQKRYLYESEKLSSEQKEIFYTYLTSKATEGKLKSALKFLVECLYTYHQKRVVVLLDEYDIPIDSAARKGYFDDMVNFMRGFMGGVFKTNDFLEFGVLTGVQRVSRESLVSSFNNPKICGIMSTVFSTCFGFTEDEVKNICETYGLGGSYDGVRRWYDGYRFGGRDMYNPWSITGFLCENEFKNYWVNTGGTTILEDIFIKGTPALKDDMAGLLTGTPIKMNYVEQIKYPIPYEKDDIFWSMLLNTGYIKPCVGSVGDVFFAELVNKEVRDVFTKCVEYWYKKQQTTIHNTVREFVGFLLQGDAESVSNVLNEDLLNNPRWNRKNIRTSRRDGFFRRKNFLCHDFKDENSYHMFIYGILLAVSSDYIVYSNPESGKGRSDCLIKPDDKSKYAVVIEFKHQSKDGDDLYEDAQRGLEQIEDKKYIHTLKREGYQNIYKYSIAFHKKMCVVVMG